MPAIPAAVTTMSSLPSSAMPVFERRLQLAGVAHVDLRRDDALPRLLDELRGLLEVLRRRHRVADRREVLTPVDGDDVGALLGQPDRVAAALAARRRR